jgi:putative ABC transport system permease protein
MSTRTRKVVLLGKNVVERLFDKDVDPWGQDVRVKDVVMKVVGVFSDKMNRGQGSDAIYIPRSTYETVYGGGGKLDNIWIRPEPGVDGFDVEKRILELVKRRHEVSPEDNRGIGSFNMAEPAQRINGLFTGINVFIWFVGLGTLMAGIVGISNIMIITVKERTREIGIRKGARRDAVHDREHAAARIHARDGRRRVCRSGVRCRVARAHRVRSAQGGRADAVFHEPEVNFSVAMTAIALLVGVGVIAGLMPALRAAKITPIEAMRAE